MRIQAHFLVVFLAGVFIASLQALGAESTIAKPRPSSEDLTSRESTAIDVYRSRSAVRPATASTGASSLRAKSTVLSDGRHWTMVPKGAVLSVPSRLQERVDVKPTGTLLPWAAFYRLNRGWLQIQNVQMPQARGERPISSATAEAYRLSGRVTVAILKGGPITVAKSALESPPSSTSSSP